MNRTRSFRVALALALLLNALGSPMAWARWLGGGAQAPAAAVAGMAPSCHGHDAAAVPSPPASLPCCDGGGCDCAAATAAMVVFVTTSSNGLPHPQVSAPFDTSVLPSHPLDDTLRPPIT